MPLLELPKLMPIANVSSGSTPLLSSAVIFAPSFEVEFASRLRLWFQGLVVKDPEETVVAYAKL